MTTPTLLKSAVEALNARLEELTPEASPEQLAYLSKSVQNMAGQGTILDIVALTDDKLQELVDAVNQVGAAPGDVIAVLEALQQAGAMSAQLIVI